MSNPQRYFDWMKAQAELHRCRCLMKDEGMPLVCDDFRDDDNGDCLTCGHREVCHDMPQP